MATLLIKVEGRRRGGASKHPRRRRLGGEKSARETDVSFLPFLSLALPILSIYMLIYSVVERILGFLFAEGKERKKRRERPTIFRLSLLLVPAARPDEQVRDLPEPGLRLVVGPGAPRGPDNSSEPSLDGRERRRGHLGPGRGRRRRERHGRADELRGKPTAGGEDVLGDGEAQRQRADVLGEIGLQGVAVLGEERVVAPVFGGEGKTKKEGGGEERGEFFLGLVVAPGPRDLDPRKTNHLKNPLFSPVHAQEQPRLRVLQDCLPQPAVLIPTEHQRPHDARVVERDAVKLPGDDVSLEDRVGAPAGDASRDAVKEPHELEGGRTEARVARRVGREGGSPAVRVFLCFFVVVGFLTLRFVPFFWRKERKTEKKDSCPISLLLQARDDVGRLRPSRQVSRQRRVLAYARHGPLVELVVFRVPNQRPGVGHSGVDKREEARVLRYRVSLAEGDLANEGVVETGGGAQVLLAVVTLFGGRNGKKRGLKKKVSFFLLFFFVVSLSSVLSPLKRKKEEILTQ